ncbi:unnamed protein product [Phaeothamnion confervicola]
MSDGRMDISWGGFNMVQAMLNGIRQILQRDDDNDESRRRYQQRQVSFDWIVTLSAATYPLQSNAAIRAELASHPANAVFVDLNPKPHKPASTAWHYYVECDSRLHRIGRNVAPRGIDMHVASQWVLLPPDFARWLVHDVSLVPRYTEYARHVVVADENFFATVAIASPFCRRIVRKNFLHVQFDEFEHAKAARGVAAGLRRHDKCLVPHPDHCGRSPTTMTVDYVPVLEHSGALFARKFNPAVDAAVMDRLDQFRRTDSGSSAGGNGTDGAGIGGWGYGQQFARVRVSPVPDSDLGSGGSNSGRGGGNGGGSTCGDMDTAVASSDASSDAAAACRGGSGGGERRTEEILLPELCLSLGAPPPGGSRNSPNRAPDPAGAVLLAPCDASDASQSLRVGPCSSDGRLGIPRGGGTVASERGRYYLSTCPLRSARGACLDIAGERTAPGTNLIPFRCSNRWNQLFSFGDGALAGHIFNSVPSHYPDSRAIGGRLCIEVVHCPPSPSSSGIGRDRGGGSGSGSAGGGGVVAGRCPSLRTAVCDTANARQKFVLAAWEEEDLASDAARTERPRMPGKLTAEGSQERVAAPAEAAVTPLLEKRRA